MPQKMLGKSSVVMGTTVATGTLIIYGLSSLYAFFNSFKLSFYTASFAIIIVALIWLMLYNKLVTGAKKEKLEDEPIVSESKTSMQNDDIDAGKRIFFASLYVLCFCAIGVNLTKDGLTTWVPSILKEEFSINDSLSILLTLFLPVVAVFGNAFAVKVHRKIPDYVNHCGVIFAIIAIMICSIIVSLTIKHVTFMLLGLVASNFFASSLNSLITSIYTLFMRGKVNSGLIAGVLNRFCYLGSTISSYGLGVIADIFGWMYVFYALMLYCFFVFIAWGIYHVVKYNKDVNF